ncbi:hypothetical protein MERGE_001907 [Pneumocystis wakefieldiae]|uniref:Uncharacterized protein n=1 Tax=Pneumocystis wakefieldiae TaxID=38082 RepID=A0A899FW54_9ASCO|nr:hypothetical protein MERGE_001907 [Pneumocystis wakefieldiae]
MIRVLNNNKYLEGYALCRVRVRAALNNVCGFEEKKRAKLLHRKAKSAAFLKNYTSSDNKLLSFLLVVKIYIGKLVPTIMHQNS